MNVLILPAGTEIGREIASALRYCKDITLFFGGERYNNHARFTCPDYHFLPAVDNAGWLDSLNTFIARHHIDFIFPAHDEVLTRLARYQPEITATVLAPSAATCEITRSKRATYAVLRDIVHLPRLYTPQARAEDFPLFVKPDRGQGAQGACKVSNRRELAYQLALRDDLIICEYLPGEEFTVDCFSDTDEGLLYCRARTRERIRNGISMSSQFVALPGIEALAQKIGQTLKMRGAWFFQVKYNQHQQLTLLEVAPRIAGTMALSRAAGVNLPLLTIYERLGYPLELLPGAGDLQISRGLVNRYRHGLTFSHVYIDFDDTLCIDGKLCLPAITFLFQCLNEGKRLSLITRHAGDLAACLKRLRISHLFDEVIHLTGREPKSRYIQPQNAIFIDDSFSERREVHAALGIATFDNSMIEVLIKD